MPESPNTNQPSVAGGSSSVPTPANKSDGWGDKIFRKGGSSDEPVNQGEGHVSANNASDTIGGFLGLKDQKARAENKFMERAGITEDVKPFTDSGEPTCAGEDHSFAGRKPGGSDALPGWESTKNFFGAGNAN